MEKLGLYIHIPFCESKCHYCGFTSGVGNEETINKYCDAIVKEIMNFDSEGYVVDTIFIGGGTPTSVNSNVIEDIVEAINANFKLDLVEFTIEGNPNNYTQEKINRYISLGVDRFSVGVQSLDDKILKSIGRVHSSEQALKCLDMLVASGLKVSADLMVGLPFQSIDIAARDAKKIIECGVKHVSCYSLILEPLTKMAIMVGKGDVVLPTDDEAVDMYDEVMNMLEAKGLKRYETSNFGLPCQHNIGYWKMKEYAGFGVSAHSFNKGVRYYNTDSLKEYINGCDIIVDEKPSIQDQADEYVMLSLRLDIGIDVKEYKEKYGEKLFIKLLGIAEIHSMYLDITNDFIAIKREYSYIANSIIEKFI